MLSLGQPVCNLIKVNEKLNDADGIEAVYLKYLKHEWNTYFGTTNDDTYYYMEMSNVFTFVDVFDTNGRLIECQVLQNKDCIRICVKEQCDCIIRVIRKKGIQSNRPYVHNLLVKFTSKTPYNRYIPDVIGNGKMVHISEVYAEFHIKFRNNRAEKYIRYSDLTKDLNTVNEVRPNSSKGYIKITYRYEAYDESLPLETTVRFIDSATITPYEIILDTLGSDTFLSERIDNNVELLNLSINNGKSITWSYENSNFSNAIISDTVVYIGR